MTYFWLCVALFCIIWYFTMTLFVGIRGFFDIMEMLRALKTDNIEIKKDTLQ